MSFKLVYISGNNAPPAMPIIKNAEPVLVNFPNLLIAKGKIPNQQLHYSIGPRRQGDAPVVYADTTKAELELGWKAQLGLDEMILSAWNWQLSVT